MSGFVRVLSRALPSLGFTLLTWCLDDDSVDVRRAVRGKLETWWQPGARHEFHWSRARKKFGLPGDAVYEDDEAREWAERNMLDEALGHWDDAGRIARAYRPRRYEWWNRPRLRDLRDEQKLFMLEYSEALSRAARSERRKPAKR